MQAVVEGAGERKKRRRCRGPYRLSGRARLRRGTRFRGGKFRPNDSRDERLHVGFSRVERADIRPVAENRHAVRDAEDLVQPMRHVDDADPMRDDRPDRIKKDLLLVPGQPRSWLAQNQPAPPADQRFGDFRHLPVGKGQRPHCRTRIEGDVVGLEKRLGFRHEATFLEKSEPGAWLTPEHKVGCDRERFDKAKVLIDDRDPSFPRFCGAAESDGPAFDLDRTSVEAVDAAEDLDERRLAGAVLPKQRMNLARLHLEADAAQRPHAAEGLRHALDVDKRVRGNGSTGGGRWSYHSGSNISSLTAASPRLSLTFHYDPEIRQAHGGCSPLAAGPPAGVDPRVFGLH